MENYLVLFSLKQPNKTTAARALAALEKIAGNHVKPIWIDAAYVGAPIATDLVASQIWNAIGQHLRHESDLRDLLIIQLGSDWCARQDSIASHWLMPHLGRPFPAPHSH